VSNSSSTSFVIDWRFKLVKDETVDTALAYLFGLSHVYKDGKWTKEIDWKAANKTYAGKLAREVKAATVGACWGKCQSSGRRRGEFRTIFGTICTNTALDYGAAAHAFFTALTLFQLEHGRKWCEVRRIATYGENIRNYRGRK
jgi:hypothetical protein